MTRCIGKSVSNFTIRKAALLAFQWWLEISWLFRESDLLIGDPVCPERHNISIPCFIQVKRNKGKENGKDGGDKNRNVWVWQERAQQEEGWREPYRTLLFLLFLVRSQQHYLISLTTALSHFVDNSIVSFRWQHRDGNYRLSDCPG